MRKNKYNKEQSHQGAVNMLKRIESHYDGYFFESDTWKIGKDLVENNIGKVEKT